MSTEIKRVDYNLLLSAVETAKDNPDQLPDPHTSLSERRIEDRLQALVNQLHLAVEGHPDEFLTDVESVSLAWRILDKASSLESYPTFQETSRALHLIVSRSVWGSHAAGSSGVFGRVSDFLETSNKYDRFYNAHIKPIAQAMEEGRWTKDVWLEHFDPVVEFVNGIERELDRETIEHFAPAVHDNGYWRTERVKVQDQSSPLLGGVIPLSDEKLGKLLTPEGLAEYEGRYNQGEKGFKIKLSVVKPEKRHEFFQAVGKTGISPEAAASMPADTVLVNANAMSWEDMQRDARNFPDPQARIARMYKNQTAAMAGTFALTRMSSPLTTAQMNEASAIIWKYTGNWDGKKGWEGSSSYLVKKTTAQLPPHELDKDEPIWKAVLELQQQKSAEPRVDQMVPYPGGAERKVYISERREVSIRVGGEKLSITVYQMREGELYPQQGRPTPCRILVDGKEVTLQELYTRGDPSRYPEGTYGYYNFETTVDITKHHHITIIDPQDGGKTRTVNFVPPETTEPSKSVVGVIEPAIPPMIDLSSYSDFEAIRVELMRTYVRLKSTGQGAAEFRQAVETYLALKLDRRPSEAEVESYLALKELNFVRYIVGAREAEFEEVISKMREAGALPKGAELEARERAEKEGKKGKGPGRGK